MKEPTEAQVKEFWEWTGEFKFIEVPVRLDSWITTSLCYIRSGDGWGLSHHPALDLNNLIKYAIPKLERWEMGSLLNGMTYARVSIDTMSPKESENKDPALSLFWAIWQIYNQGG